MNKMKRKMSRTKKVVVFSVLSAVIVALLALIWFGWMRPTRIGFINYQSLTLGEISRANQNAFIKLKEIPVDEIDKASDLKHFDIIFVNAMGLRITAEQRELIKAVGEKNVPIVTTMATNPANNINTLDSLYAKELKEYISAGGRANFHNMLEYVRKYVDKKRFFTSVPAAPVPFEGGMLYHADPQHPENENLYFNSVKDYVAFLSKNHIPNAKAVHPAYRDLSKQDIIVTGQMGDATDLISMLEKMGYRVFPVARLREFIAEHVDSIQPGAVINMAHGRLGDEITQFLQEKNIPLFSPLNVNCPVEEWEADKMGMQGGFMSQSIVTPEIDGAVLPYTLFAHRKSKDGFQELYAIPERLATFVKTIDNYMNLQQKPNADKRVVVFYYKGAGQNSLTAAGMSVVPSLFNVLVDLKERGYNLEGMPSSAEALEKLIMQRGAVFGAYAEGAISDFIASQNPLLINKKDYDAWVEASLRPEQYAEVVSQYGDFPGDYMATSDGHLALACLRFGNVVLMPQTAAGRGDNQFEVVHGTDIAPPHSYIAPYLWAQYAFKADAMLHFGTHGSLEFTPRKQVALSNSDWSDRLVGAIPHFYLYTVDNVGEAMIAKRRSYACIISYLTPPYMESNVRPIYMKLNEAIESYNKQPSEAGAQVVKKLTLQLGIQRSLGLDSLPSTRYSSDDIARIERFVEELANEKMTGQLYTMGVPYEEARIRSTVYALSTDPIAYSLYALDRQRGRAGADVAKHASLFAQKYLSPAKQLVGKLLHTEANDAMLRSIAGLSQHDLDSARRIYDDMQPRDLLSMMMSMGESMRGSAPTGGGSKMTEAQRAAMKERAKGMSPDLALKMAKKMGASEEALKKMEAAMKGSPAQEENPGKASASAKGSDNETASKMEQVMEAMTAPKNFTKAQREWATAVHELERTVGNVAKYREMLRQCPRRELDALANALNGGYVLPSPGGDPIANPQSLPTGRNLYAINAENTPTEAAWDKGKELAEQTIALYRQKHHDSLPRKVSYTLWSSEFIQTEGATIAQVLYMLGVEPVRDAFGRVTDLRLISSKELGRPRIDVVVQTSGQLRDLAASRLFLISRAVEMAAEAKDKEFANEVAAGVHESEKTLIEKGIPPKEAREMASRRVFGGVNGGYGTGIQGMVMSGDRWEESSEIASTYLNNMSSFYGDEKDWEASSKSALEAALTRTDMVVQPRQSNSWGALSLDHVYEFMGGMDLAVRNVTGKEPDAYLADYRNRSNFRMQEVKEAIGVESRTTLFNPTYIKEKMKGGSSDANAFAELVQNTYGWNVMKPDAIDNEIWDEIYETYVKDQYDLGTKQYFEDKNPAAIEEITAVMMESARKGMWKATDQQLKDVAQLHTEIVNKYKPSCSGFVCDNAKLRQYIEQQVDEASAQEYRKNINDIRTASDKQGTVMKKETIQDESTSHRAVVSNTLIAVGALLLLVGSVLFIRKRRKQSAGSNDKPNTEEF